LNMFREEMNCVACGVTCTLQRKGEIWNTVVVGAAETDSVATPFYLYPNDRFQATMKHSAIDPVTRQPVPANESDKHFAGRDRNNPKPFCLGPSFCSI
jgi:hypothetical protein